MSQPILIKGVRVIDPAQGMDKIGDILVKDGVIASCGPTVKADDALVIQGKGLVASPGFIDLHAHLREPGFEDKETIATGTKAGARGGFTTLCCMPNTNPAIDSASVADFILHQAKLAGPVRVFPIGAATKGRLGKEITEMEELARAGAVAFSDDGSPIADGHIMRMALTYAHDLGLPVIDHCEEVELSHKGTMHEGWVSSRLGVSGYPAVGEESMIARDIAIAEMTRSHVHIAHVSTAGGAELVRRGKERGINVTAEVTPHHLTMSEEWVLGIHDLSKVYGPLTANAYDSRAKVSPPLRRVLDAQALAAALKDGAIDAIATDHAPHTIVDKAVPLDDAVVGISVLETAFGSLMQLVHNNVLDLSSLIYRMTVAPATVLGSRFGELATLRAGTPADITLFDPDEEWLVDTRQFASKGTNTPLDGEKLKGRVKLTMAQGVIAYNGLSNNSGARN